MAEKKAMEIIEFTEMMVLGVVTKHACCDRLRWRATLYFPETKREAHVLFCPRHLAQIEASRLAAATRPFRFFIYYAVETRQCHLCGEELIGDNLIHRHCLLKVMYRVREAMYETVSEGKGESGIGKVLPPKKE